jgi:hypothetical protein
MFRFTGHPSKTKQLLCYDYERRRLTSPGSVEAYIRAFIYPGKQTAYKKKHFS